MLESVGIEPVLKAPQAPWQNGVAERSPYRAISGKKASAPAYVVHTGSVRWGVVFGSACFRKEAWQGLQESPPSSSVLKVKRCELPKLTIQTPREFPADPLLFLRVLPAGRQFPP